MDEAIGDKKLWYHSVAKTKYTEEYKYYIAATVLNFKTFIQPYAYIASGTDFD